MKIAMFGTFDIANFGDILFPITAEKMLSDRDPSLELRRYSYRPKDARDWHYDVRSIGQFEKDLADTDLVLIGGGHLIHTNRFMAPGYGPTEDGIPHPFGFWWLPAVAGRMAGVPVALHAVSVAEQHPRWSRPMHRAFAESVTYPTVRDRLSQQRMRDMGAPDTRLVPDSIFTIDRLVKRDTHSDGFRKFVADHKLKRPYIIVQPSTTLRNEQPVISRLLEEANQRGWAILELPIFQEKLNKTGSYNHIPGVISAKYDPPPLLLTEIIANAEGTIGVSLHLSIVSAVYGVPVYRKRYAADSKFVLLDDIGSGFQFLDADPRLVEHPGRPDPAIAEFQAQLDTHYDRLIELASRPAQEERKARGFAMLTATPDSMRAGQDLDERLSDEILRLRRARNFASAAASAPLRRVISNLRRS